MVWDIAFGKFRRGESRQEPNVPQRFYTHQQTNLGDRHLYACRSRFIPDSIMDSFDCHSWHERVQASSRPAKKGATTDVAASLRRTWR
jgi:DNA helicase II / ATP-dependent DNA helicase PcrA